MAEKAGAAESMLRQILRENDSRLDLGDSARLGNVINALLRWRHRHAARCPYCECERTRAARPEKETTRC